MVLRGDAASCRTCDTGCGSVDMRRFGRESDPEREVPGENDGSCRLDEACMGRGEVVEACLCWLLCSNSSCRRSRSDRGACAERMTSLGGCDGCLDGVDGRDSSQRA